MGPQMHELAIFLIKLTPFEFGFSVGNCLKISKLDNSGPIGRPPNMSETAHNIGPKNTRVGIFFTKLNPFQFGFCTIDQRKIFKIGPFWADWQTPYFSNGPQYGAPNTYLRGL